MGMWIYLERKEDNAVLTQLTGSLGLETVNLMLMNDRLRWLERKGDTLCMIMFVQLQKVCISRVVSASVSQQHVQSMLVG